MKFYGQNNQDNYLYLNFFKNKKNGFFIDVGANDGLQLSNTLFFEQFLGWTGICIEPLPETFLKLQQNRPNCINLNVAIDETEQTMDFLANTGYNEMLSGLYKHYYEQHKQRISKENNEFHSSSKMIKVDTLRLESILDAIEINHVDLLKIDVEGAEMSVLKSINFDKVTIDVILVECNYHQQYIDISKFLIPKGFVQHGQKIGSDYIFVHNTAKFS